MLIKTNSIKLLILQQNKFKLDLINSLFIIYISEFEHDWLHKDVFYSDAHSAILNWAELKGFCIKYTFSINIDVL